MSVIIGSARRDEKSGYSGGVKGDSVQTSSPDYKGEVSMQNFYVHKKGWNVLRPKDPNIAHKIAENMKSACNNKNLGYSQSDRYGVIKNGIKTTIPSNCDCSSLVRACVKEASGKDPGDFTTANAIQKLSTTGLFEAPFPYSYDTPLHEGDILCTKTKGHIVIVTDGGNPKTGNFDNPYAEPKETIKFGSRGNGVKWVQYELNQHGYKVAVDGDFKSKTEAAVKDFQKRVFPHNPNEWDGIVGIKTREKLKT